MSDITNEFIASNSTIEAKVNLPELGFIILRHVSNQQWQLFFSIKC